MRPSDGLCLRRPLALATVALLGGARSLYANAQWGREQSEAVVWALGFTRQQTPGVTTLHRLFKALDVDVFEAILGQWAQTASAVGERRSPSRSKRCAASMGNSYRACP